MNSTNDKPDINKQRSELYAKLSDLGSETKAIFASHPDMKFFQTKEGEVEKHHLEEIHAQIEALRAQIRELEKKYNITPKLDSPSAAPLLRGKKD